MRIIVASPPKTGNVWVRNLLSRIYGLAQLEDEPSVKPHMLARKIDAGWFIDDAIFHQHYWPTDELLEAANSVDVQMVTTLRHPYDLFVSLYFYVQNFPGLFGPKHRLASLTSRAINDPEIFDFLSRGRDGFGHYVDLGDAWLSSGESLILRYEELKADPLKTLKSATRAIRPVSGWTLRRAIRSSSAKAMRRIDDGHQRHVRSASVGDWVNHLERRHIEIINSHHGAAIERLGYILTDPERI